jgi:hypothetical protein
MCSRALMFKYRWSRLLQVPSDQPSSEQRKAPKFANSPAGKFGDFRASKGTRSGKRLAKARLLVLEGERGH